jgi:hypothetical protein
MQTGKFAGSEREAAKNQRPAHDDADMKARDGKQMSETGGGECRTVRWRDPSGYACEQRDTDRASRPGHHCRNALCDDLPQALHNAKQPRGWCLSNALDNPQRVARTSLATVPGVTLKIPCARIGGRHWRPHERPHTNGIAGGDVLRVAFLQPDSQPALNWLPAVQLHLFQCDPASLGEQLHRANLAG